MKIGSGRTRWAFLTETLFRGVPLSFVMVFLCIEVVTSFLSDFTMRILFAVNLEEPESVCSSVVDLANRLDAELYILHVCSPKPPAFASADPVSGLGDLASYALFDPDLQRNLDEAESSAFDAFLARSFQTPVKASMRKGFPASTILEDADANDVDMIVVGRRHHGRLERFLVGDVASDIVKHSTRQVLLVPIPDDDEQS